MKQPAVLIALCEENPYDLIKFEGNFLAVISRAAERICGPGSEYSMGPLSNEF